MSGYRPGHEQGHDPYIGYAAAHPEAHPEERGYASHVQELQHVGAQGLAPLHEQHLAAQQHHHHHQHQQQQQQQQHAQQHHQQQHSAYTEHPMAHHQSPPFGGGQGMAYGPPRRQQPAGTKRARPDDLEAEMEGLTGQQMQMVGMQGMSSQMPPQSMVGGDGYDAQPMQYHSHALPNQGHRSKMPRMSDNDSVTGPSVVGQEGMPQPAPRPRGPKLKFTPEDDSLLVDLKENKSLTWKQIAEFFPGRSSGTLQVRYCTKLKAKTTQWTEETVQKLRTALHDYEQEKWRIVAQKVGTGFTSAACKEKASEL
ncbi:uncharacterized protein L3040_002336 [Drepanopeziza brunnea f. sp. 'multigermtubi']|uniref:MYB DNA-binding domain-containing protein n=1 Tax=Marssonina brunnea f. sp. multigermtubi (strain MB_m1) TaxID=1072389 RepID=K1X448_MARBU|nr:MYB DNA-binding domain-containing protein [Drepanopeziza brunnea f. sp. 'multigermtubi' MB_m1]EKD19986.1 MYB DNA-binding domain-containing protein [Drepanopeziza brunnea f. sp. 'multigermtubi' MB_m1]KAJ5050453.1 hypothetical protein L3040_002336 [Drepanopeziza brunnea f. sp. 'multigermtubi']